MRGVFRTSKVGGKKKPTIEEWEIGDFFGFPVVRGYVAGERVTARLLWWANNRFGVARDGVGTEVVYKTGNPA